MILQALNGYYERLRTDSSSAIPAFGFSVESVAHCVILAKNGDVVGVHDLRERDGNRVVLKKVVVPKPPKERSGTKAPAYFLWDKSKYVIGCVVDSKGNRQFHTFAFDDFAKRQFELLEGVEDMGAKAFSEFVKKRKFGEIPSWANDDVMSGRFMVFQLDGEPGFLHEREGLRGIWLRHLEKEAPEDIGQCLITGLSGQAIANTHSQIKNVQGANTAGAALVSFNATAFESYNKGKGNLNAPVSERAAFAYTTALNHLLAPESPRKLRVGDTTAVFWTEARGEAEKFFNFAMGGKHAEDNDQARRLEGYLSAVAKGKYPEELGDVETPFFVLGLSPNAARLSVRFWHMGTVGEMAENVGEHYRALALQRRFDSDPEHPSPWHLLKELAPQRDSKNMSPLLFGQFVRSVIQGLPYPQTLLSAAIGRIRADKEVNYLRAAVIKAFLVRNRKQEIPMTLDSTNMDIGYRLGRLFAIVERIQEEAVPGANATVRDRFFASAAATPARTFPIIVKNAQHGLAKIRKDKPGWAKNLDKAIQEIAGGIDAATGFPASMPSDKQGMFILGYYQQRQDFYTKKEKNTED